ncbi:UDP-N-acetylglucosamine 2-epimerase (non-hydrolyzing) [Actinopolymorpha sp. B11F2]|uniref:non-hydrolyzing UDP-N-acetylglucosamine 2-epimerase n=1 Tax=Actinopolymorpha sp. B11F2 TaxID=3160862 RepID=UPI0032E4405A
MTVVHITGARPNFPKAAPVIAALRASGAAQQLVHTGQHYDDKLSEVFFRELDLPRPDVNLGVGSGTHATQTAAVMTALEEQFRDQRPSLVVVYGDVNSTLAAALVCSKLGVPLAHVEAGLRSFDLTMPEEINRKVTDALSDLAFATSPEAIAHLAREGVPAERIHLVGNPMIDTLLAHLDRFDPAPVREAHGLSGAYAVATLHRPGNVDGAEQAVALVQAMHKCADQVPIVVPLHPRGRARLLELGFADHHGIRVVEPLGYVEFMSLVRGAAAVLTDSGGVQEETTVLGVPCLTLRPSTERPVTISHGTNQLVKAETLPHALQAVLDHGPLSSWPVPPLWDGRAGVRIAEILVSWLGNAGTVPAPGTATGGLTTASSGEAPTPGKRQATNAASAPTPGERQATSTASGPATGDAAAPTAR